MKRNTRDKRNELKKKNVEKEKILEEKWLREENEKRETRGEEKFNFQKKREVWNEINYCGLCDEYTKKGRKHEHKRKTNTPKRDFIERSEDEQERTVAVKVCGGLKESKYLKEAFCGYQMRNVQHVGWHCGFIFENKKGKNKVVLKSKTSFLKKALQKIEIYMDNLCCVVCEIKKTHILI